MREVRRTGGPPSRARYAAEYRNERQRRKGAAEQPQIRRSYPAAAGSSRRAGFRPASSRLHEEVCMLDFGLTKRCNCPQRLWTKGCPHSWHYAFKWKRERFRSALDDVLRRHVDSKTEALREVEKIYDAVRAGALGAKPAAQTRGAHGPI